MVADSSFRCFGFDKPIISENGNLVHHDHPHQAPPEFLKRLKYGLNVAGGTFLLEQGIVGTLQRIVSQPFVPAGFVCYAVSSLLWLDVLSKLEISKAYPLVSLSYVFSLLIGLLVFRDQIGWVRVAGVGLICAGVVLVAQS